MNYVSLEKGFGNLPVYSVLLVARIFTPKEMLQKRMLTSALEAVTVKKASMREICENVAKANLLRIAKCVVKV